MPLTRARIIQVLSVVVVDAVVLFLLALLMPGVAINTFASAVVLVIAVSVIQAVVWWLFINLFAHLPAILFPILTFVLIGGAISFFGKYIPGITIDGFWPGVWIAVIITVVNAILGALFVLDEDSSF